jgi:hypothetical protein
MKVTSKFLDPYNYFDRFINMPMLLVSSTDDEFMMADDDQ